MLIDIAVNETFRFGENTPAPAKLHMLHQGTTQMLQSMPVAVAVSFLAPVLVQLEDEKQLHFAVLLGVFQFLQRRSRSNSVIFSY